MARMSSPQGRTLELLPAEESLEPLTVHCVKVLGKGRAAEARLVHVGLEDGRTVRCVEKVFCPGLLTRSIYRVCFQSAFAYQYNQDAILASFYRRRIVWAITRAFMPEVGVARPLYVRWDPSSKAMVLASDYVAGRGILPQQLDPYMLRRWLHKKATGKNCDNLLALESKGEADSGNIPPSPHEEIDELLDVMQRFESLLLESGLVGTGWQVCKRAVVSTANLLRTEEGYVSVDLESGIPSVLVSTYLREGIRLGSFPLFDCLDAERLRRWSQANQTALDKALSVAESTRFIRDIELLMVHTNHWKDSEPAILRSPKRLLSSEFREKYENRIIDQWVRCDIVDSETLDEIRQSTKRLTSRPVYWLGCIPGKLGRFLQRCVANSQTRQNVRSFCNDPGYRRQVIGDVFDNVRRSLNESRRVPAQRLDSLSRWGLCFHWAVSKTTPQRVHRILSDREYRSNWLIRLCLLCVSGRFQRDYGRWIIQRRFQSWQDDKRLTDSEKQLLSQDLGCPAIEEYLRGFGTHVGLKLLLPVVVPLKAVGAAAFVASGNPIYFLLMFFLLPILRTLTTIWWMLNSGQPARNFRDALIVGTLPTVGTLAFPVQMGSSCPHLTAFLMRDFASQLGRFVPVYGGKDSRTEIAFIKAVNAVSEVLEMWLKLTKSNRESAQLNAEASSIMKTKNQSYSRWDQMAIAQILLIQSESTENQEPKANAVTSTYPLDKSATQLASTKAA